MDLSFRHLLHGREENPTLNAEHAESAENPKVLFSAVFAVSAVIVDFSTHFQRLIATICNSTRAPAFSAAT